MVPACARSWCHLPFGPWQPILRARIPVSTGGLPDEKFNEPKADYCDNATTENFWGRLKVARLYGRKFETRIQAMDEVFDWMTFYNDRRIHSMLGYVSPMQFEKSWHAA